MLIRSSVVQICILTAFLLALSALGVGVIKTSNLNDGSVSFSCYYFSLGLKSYLEIPVYESVII